MRKLLLGCTLLLSNVILNAQIAQRGNSIEVKTTFIPQTHYTYDVVFTQSKVNQQDTVVTHQQQLLVDLYSFSEGEGFSIIEWTTPTISFNSLADDSATELLNIQNNKPFKLSYRTDELGVIGEVSNFDEIAEIFGKLYQETNKQTVEENYELATNTGMYLTSLFHQFYGLHFPVDKKTTMSFLFYNPMTQSFESSKNDILYLGNDKTQDLYGFEIEQKGLQSTEDNSVGMMNHKKVSTFKNTKKGDNYSIESFGKRSYKGNGLPYIIEQTTRVKTRGEEFLYTLKMSYKEQRTAK